MRFRGLPSGGLDTSGLNHQVGQGPAYKRAPERVTNVAQGQEGATEEVTQWMSKEDGMCKGLGLQSVAVSVGRAGRSQQEALQLRASTLESDRLDSSSSFAIYYLGVSSSLWACVSSVKWV